MENSSEQIASRVDDIERTIGDLWQVLDALKQALARVGPPNCPPYCGYEVTHEYEDPLSLEDRVKDMKKRIGDMGIVFGALSEVFASVGPPNCPPYCAHEISEQS